MVHILKHYVPVDEYAKLCGVIMQTINDRIKSNYISVFAIGNFRFVDVLSDPPVRFFRGRKAKRFLPIPDAYKYSEGEAKPSVIVSNNLKIVSQIAVKLKQTPHTIYEQIILGKVEAIVIGGEVFLDTYRYPIQSFKGKKIKKK